MLSGHGFKLNPTSSVSPDMDSAWQRTGFFLPEPAAQNRRKIVDCEARPSPLLGPSPFGGFRHFRQQFAGRGANGKSGRSGFKKRRAAAARHFRLARKCAPHSLRNRRAGRR